MPTVINPAVGETFPGSVTGPADGDLANAASVNGAFQSLMNGVDLARIGLYGARLKPRYAVTQVGDGGANHPQVTIEALGKILVTEGGIWKILSHTVQSVIDLHTLLGAQTAAATRYYIYASSVGGVLTWVVSTQAPGADLRYSGGAASTDQAYIGTVYSRALDICLHEYEYGGVHMIGTSGPAVGLTPIVNAASAAALTAAAVNGAQANLVPAYAKQLRLRGRVVPAAAGIQILLCGNNAGTDQEIFITQSINDFWFDSVVVPEDGANVYWEVNAPSTLTLYVVGWYDPR